MHALTHAVVEPLVPAVALRAAPRLLRTVADCRAFAAEHHAAGRTVALVPTMGYLHDGHLSLVARAREEADVVVMSIYVNPTQFAAGEDLDTYPRDEAGDLAKATAAGCAAVFLPTTDVIYPRGHSATQVAVPALQQTLCAVDRPTHFPGVALVVTKLFNITGCDVAVFGEKDFQQ
ncbi:MAG: pantoate--beta-alanine ligase, partial [Myxococcales bacterium]|nr:pantoate--beta-alanine ligase [Myxococcales bacterium]